MQSPLKGLHKKIAFYHDSKFKQSTCKEMKIQIRHFQIWTKKLVITTTKKSRIFIFLTMNNTLSANFYNSKYKYFSIFRFLLANYQPTNMRFQPNLFYVLAECGPQNKKAWELLTSSFQTVANR